MLIFCFHLTSGGLFIVSLEPYHFPTKTSFFVRFLQLALLKAKLTNKEEPLIPQNLRDHSSLNKDAIIIGTPNRIEIWSEENWNAYTSDEHLSYENIAEQMEELGF